MTAKLDYTWKLREVMATRGLFQTTHLRPKLAERGIRLSDSQVYRLVTDKPERLNLKVLMALLDILGCRMDDLIEPVAVPAVKARKKAAGGGDAEPGIGASRPRRARGSSPTRARSSPASFTMPSRPWTGTRSPPRSRGPPPPVLSSGAWPRRWARIPACSPPGGPRDRRGSSC
jgi:DNA-binding Xre family transcriptional regulator